MTFWKTLGDMPFIRSAAITALVVLLHPAFPHPAAAEVGISGNSSTFMLYRETAAGEKVLGGFEYINFAVQNPEDGSISFHTGGWLRYNLQGDLPGSQSADDIQYSYLSLRRKNDNAVLNLGRVMVFEGIATERVDGAYARTDLKGGFGVSAFGGIPVLTNDEDDSGTDSIYGARISRRQDGLYSIGLSYLKQRKNSLDFREEGGIDLWLRPFNKVELMGKSTYDAITNRWMQDTYNLLLGPFAKLKLNTEFSWIDYESYFAANTNSAFTFLPAGPLGTMEQLTVLGETALYDISDKVSCSADYKQYSYDMAGSAKYYGAGLRYSAPKAMAAGVSVHRMDGETDRLNYDEYRIYVFKKVGHYDLTMDLLNVKYDEPVNNVSSAYSATLAGGYELSERLLLGADVEYAKNPDFDKEVRLFAKLTYNFEVVKARPAAAPVSAPAPAAEPVKPAAEIKEAVPTTPAAAEPVAPPVTEPAAAPQPGEQGKVKEGVQ